jgi:DNA polymerase-1
MVNLHNNKRLKEIKYKILLQIHDEIILEGPEENAKEAFDIVKHVMENPFDIEFPVKMEVDAKIGNNWYESK